MFASGKGVDVVDDGLFMEWGKDVRVGDFERIDSELGKRGGRGRGRRTLSFLLFHTGEKLCGVVKTGLLCCRHVKLNNNMHSIKYLCVSNGRKYHKHPL